MNKELIERLATLRDNGCYSIDNCPDCHDAEDCKEEYEEIKQILEQQAQPGEELVSVCCQAKIKIEKIETANGYYNAEICSKCEKEIVETPQPKEQPQQDEKLVESIINSIYIIKRESGGLDVIQMRKDIRKLLKGEK